MFSGSYVALVTPFKNGNIDLSKLKELVEFHIKNGTSGLVPCGTTGESATLTHEEEQKIIETIIKIAKDKIKIIVGTGSNNTEEALEYTRFAKNAGADGALLISPYYNKPTQKGLYLHFKKIADEIKFPLILYNIQSRTGVNIEPETLARLYKDCPENTIVAVKESSGSLDQMSRIKQLCPDIDLFSGDDSLTLPVLSIGGCGIISVAANIVPKDMNELVKSFMNANFDAAKKLHYKLFPLIRALFIETNPIPVKTAMGLMGICSPELRLPMCEMDEKNKEKLKTALKEYGLL